jgi:hypothetical protein
MPVTFTGSSVSPAPVNTLNQNKTPTVQVKPATGDRAANATVNVSDFASTAKVIIPSGQFAARSGANPPSDTSLVYDSTDFGESGG